MNEDDVRDHLSRIYNSIECLTAFEPEELTPLDKSDIAERISSTFLKCYYASPLLQEITDSLKEKLKEEPEEECHTKLVCLAVDFYLEHT